MPTVVTKKKSAPLKTLSPLTIAHVWVAAGGDRSDAPIAAAIAMGESGGRVGAIGNDPGGTQGLGLWQITTGYNDDVIAKYGGRTAMLTNPEANAKAAIAIQKRQGWRAWVVYNQGIYKRFMKPGWLRNPGDTGPGDFGAGSRQDDNPGILQEAARGPLGDAVDVAATPLKILADIGGYLLSPQWWAKIGMYAAGVLLIGFGLVLFARDFAASSVRAVKGK